MKAKDFNQFISDYVELLQISDAHDASRRWQELNKVFVFSPDKTVSQLLKSIDKIKPASGGSGIELGQIKPQITQLKSFLKKPAKAAYVNDLTALEKTLTKFENVSFEQFIDAALATLENEEHEKLKKQAKKEEKLRKQQELVAEYTDKLTDALRDEQRFPEIVQEIKKFKVADIKLIATKFSGHPASKLKNKSIAIEAINDRHEALVLGRRKSEATGDHIAA